MDVSIWMLVGFLLAAYSVVANDSLQTLGTYLSSNRKRTPKPVQMLFICTVTCGVLLLGWFLNNGDPTWGASSVPGKEFPWPEPFTWVYVIPPLAVVALTQWGAPVSTSFLVLSSFMPANIGTLLSSSLTGYGLAFGVGLAAMAWGCGRWSAGCSVVPRTAKTPARSGTACSGSPPASSGACGWCRTWPTFSCSCRASWTSSRCSSARWCSAWASVFWWPPGRADPGRAPHQDQQLRFAFGHAD